MGPGSDKDDAEEPWVPEELGRYRLTERIGAGGMAEVFLATQSGAAGFQQTVVVKRILKHLTQDPRFAEMFKREAQVIAGFNHSNIVRINELGEHNGQLFIAMEYIDGLSLNRLAPRAWRARRSVPTEVVISALADAAAGLHHAHSRKNAAGETSPVIHRDVSPENLMMDREGVTKVLDFGIAKPATTDELTQAGEVKGKLPFMSPEQIRGEVLDPRTDVYSLGVTAFWLLTGRRPHVADGAVKLLNQILRVSAPPPSTYNPEIPPPLDELVTKMLSRDREERPASALDVYEILAPMVPLRTKIVVPWVEMALELTGTGDASALATDGFVPSRPTTAVVKTWTEQGAGDTNPTQTEAHKDIAPGLVADLRGERAGAGVVDTRITEAAPDRGSGRRALMAGAAAAGLATAGVLAALFFLTGDPPEEALAPPPEEPAATAVDPGPAGAAPPPAEAVTAEDPPQDPPVEDPAATPESAVAPVTPVPAPKPAAKPRPSSVAPKARAPARPTRAVAAKAPKRIRWLLPGGQKLGSGTTTLRVPVGVDTLTAVDSKRHISSRVSVSGDRVDYGKLPRGTLDVRVKPFANVFVGGDALGPTPFAPVKLVAGKYKLRLVGKERTETRTVVVSAGKIARVIVRFDKP